jgi:hypothetical protein
MATLLLMALALGGASTREDTVRVAPVWVLERDDPQLNESFNAWLSIPWLAVAKATLDVRLDSPSDLKLWFREPGESCEQARAANRHVWHGEISGDTLLYACGTLSERGSFPLLAIGQLRTSGSGVTRFVVATRVAARGSWSPGPLVFAVLTALFGVGSGLLTYYMQQVLSRREQRKTNQSELVRKLGEELSPEIKRNVELITSYLSGTRKDAPILQTRGHNVILGDRGVMSFLRGEKDRMEYLGRLDRLYALTRSYNRSARGHHTGETQRAARDFLREAETWSSDQEAVVPTAPATSSRAPA